MDEKYVLILVYQKENKMLFNFPVFHRARMDSHVVPASNISFNLKILENCSFLTYNLHQRNSTASELGFDSLEEAVEAAESLLKTNEDPQFNNFNPDKDSLKAIIRKLMPAEQNLTGVSLENNPVVVDYTFGTLYPHRMDQKNMERAKKVKLKYEDYRKYAEFRIYSSRFFEHGISDEYGVPYN